MTMASYSSLQEVSQVTPLHSTMQSPVLSPGSIVNSSSVVASLNTVTAYSKAVLTDCADGVAPRRGVGQSPQV